MGSVELGARRVFGWCRAHIAGATDLATVWAQVVSVLALCPYLRNFSVLGARAGA